MQFPGLGLIARERARLRRFLGRDLPPRTLDPKLDPLPLPGRARGPGGPRSERAIETALAAARGTPTETIDAATRLARGLTRQRLGDRRRFALLELLTTHAARVLLPALGTLAQEGTGVPEPPARAAQVDLALRLTDALLDGYRQSFAHDYARSAFWYARVRHRVHLAAARLLELLKLQHRLLGLRYAPLPAHRWRLANAVYAVMRAAEGTDLPLPTLAALAGLADSADAPREASLDQRFAALQTYRLLDYAAWPEVAQPYIDAYCLAVDRGIVIHDYDGYTPLTARDILLTACWQDGPPRRELPVERSLFELGPCVILDYRILAQTIRYDFAELSRARATRNRLALPPRVAALPAVQQTAIGYLLKRNLAPPETWEEAGGAAQARDLRIYVGLAEVRAHLLSIFSADGGAQRSRVLSNIFAQRSAMIGADDTATHESLWFVLYEGDRRLRIRTQETRFTYRMFIGNLLAFGFGAAGAHQPRLGKVNRIARPEPGTLILDLETLADFALPVVLSPAQPNPDIGAAAGGGAADTGLPALLIAHLTRGWGVITPPQEQVWEATPVLLRVGRQSRSTVLGDAEDVTAEFCWFALPEAPFPTLTPVYPAQASERAASAEAAAMQVTDSR